MLHPFLAVMLWLTPLSVLIFRFCETHQTPNTYFVFRPPGQEGQPKFSWLFALEFPIAHIMGYRCYRIGSKYYISPPGRDTWHILSEWEENMASQIIDAAVVGINIYLVYGKSEFGQVFPIQPEQK